MTDNVLRREEIRGLSHLVMDDGANALTPTLMTALCSAVGELRTQGAPPILLRSSHHDVFCPGWDLKALAGADENSVAEFLRGFNRLIVDLFSYPGPTAVAIEGHAVAGGCLLALCCDLRIMEHGRPRIGLSELNLGVPVPASSLMMLRARLAPNVVEELVVGGDGCSAERARDMGLVHRCSEPGQTVTKTERELNRLASKPAAAFAATKQYLLADTWAMMSEVRPDDDRAFLECWFSEETQRRIGGMVERLGG